MLGLRPAVREGELGAVEAQRDSSEPMGAGGEREATMQARRAKTSMQYIIACGSEDTPADRRRWLSGTVITQDTGHRTGQDTSHRTDVHASRSLAT